MSERQAAQQSPAEATLGYRLPFTLLFELTSRTITALPCTASGALVSRPQAPNNDAIRHCHCTGTACRS